MRFTPLALAALLALAGNATAEEQSAKLTGENCKITFVGAKPNGDSHTGGFKELTGTATCDPADPAAAKIVVEIDTASIYSDSAKLTAHLKTPDFFNIREHPKAKFETTKVEKTDEGMTITGELTMLGTTKTVSFPAKMSVTEKGFTLTCEVAIDRTEFGMNYGQGQINDEVKVTVTINTAG